MDGAITILNLMGRTLHFEVTKTNYTSDNNTTIDIRVGGFGGEVIRLEMDSPDADELAELLNK